jgi:hypothetical protein
MQPKFIVLEIPLPSSLDEYFKSVTKDARNNLKKVNKNGFSYVILKDKSWVDTFYNQYYVPTMVGRHEEDAVVLTKHEISVLINQHGIEFVNLFLENECVASAITRVEDGKYYCEKIGYLNGDNSLLEKGVVTALYQFRIQRAHELGCKTIVLGGTPPFLENGVLKYKSKWLARFSNDHYYNAKYLLLNPKNLACYEFLRDNSLVVFGLNNSLIVLSSKLPTTINISGIILDDIKSWYILRLEPSDSYQTGMEDLPLHLRYWYEKV